MSLNAKKAPGGSGPSYPPMEAGTYPCRVVQVIDLGLQPQRPYKGQEKKPAYTMMVTYEFVDEFLPDEDGNDDVEKPRWLSETFPLYNLSSEKAISTQRYHALDPDGNADGDWTQLVDAPCMVTVIQNVGKDTNVRNYVRGVAPMREKDAAKLPELVNPPKVFNLDEPDMTIFKSLPDWLQEKIKDNLEFEGSPLEEAIANNVEGEEAPKETNKNRGSKKKPAPEELPSEDEEEDGEEW